MAKLIYLIRSLRYSKIINATTTTTTINNDKNNNKCIHTAQIGTVTRPEEGRWPIAQVNKWIYLFF